MATMISEVYRAFIKGGVPEKEAREAAEALSAENLSTKSDVAEAAQRLSANIFETEQRLSGEIAALREELTGQIAALREELIGKINAVEKSLRVEIDEIKQNIVVMKWMLGATLTGIFAILAALAPLLFKTLLQA